MVDHLPKSATHYFTPKKFDHFCPQREKRLLKTKREIVGESEEGKKVIWCEELGNDSIGYKYH